MYDVNVKVFILQVIHCCPKCTSVLEWKIKYGKYKPLTTPAKCVDCLQKVVKHSYHIRCGPCVEKSGKCAKCGVQVNVFSYHIHFIAGMLAKPSPPVVSNQLYCF